MAKKDDKRGQIAPFNTVTTAYLNHIGACLSGIKRFKEHFPEGSATWYEIVEAYTRGGKEGDLTDLVWFIRRNDSEPQVCVTAADVIKTSAAAGAVYRDMSTLLYDLAYKTPASIKEFTWQVRRDITEVAITLDILQNELSPSVARSQAYASRHATATYCPSNVRGGTFAARLSYVMDARSRASVAIHCPPGTIGATWAERCKHVKTRADRLRLALNWALPATFNQRLALLDRPRDRVELARWAQPTMRGATWKARLAVCKTAQQRNILARHAPCDTPGATWEARLKVTSPHARARLASYGTFNVPYTTRLAALTTPRERAYFAVNSTHDVCMPWDERVALLRTDADRVTLATRDMPYQYGVTREMRVALLPDSLTGESRDDAVALINALTTQ